MKQLLALVALSAVSTGFAQIQSDPAPAKQTATNQDQMSKYRLEVLDGNNSKATDPFSLRIALKDSRGITAKNFGSTKAAEMHLIVASPGFGYFQVLAPTMQSDGSWTAQNVILPYGGTYWVFADGGPTGDMMPAVVGKLVLQGDAAPTGVPAYANNKSGNAVWASSQTLRSGETSTVTFSLQDPISNTAITDLEPYMGANAHLFIISDDGHAFIHAISGGTTTTDSSSNLVTFNTMFPRPGKYTAFLVFKRAENVNMVPFPITVQ